MFNGRKALQLRLNIIFVHLSEGDLVVNGLNLERAKEDISQIIHEYTAHRGKGHICHLSRLNCCILQSHSATKSKCIQINIFSHISRYQNVSFHHGFLHSIQYLDGSHLKADKHIVKYHVKNLNMLFYGIRTAFCIHFFLSNLWCLRSLKICLHPK